MMKLSILIVNWNTTDFLIKCLESIFGNPPEFQFEIIIVDNNSDEDTSHIKEKFPDIKLIKCKYNYGFGVGTNIGFRNSSGKYVMTLNPDTLLISGTINKLVRTLEENEDVAIAVPVLIEQKVSKSQYSFFNLFFNSIVLRKIRGFLVTSDKGEEKEPFDVEFLGGTGYICRAFALREDYMFSEDNFLFGEEYYLCRQINDKGYKIRVVPSANFKHHMSVTFKNNPERLAIATNLGSSVGWRIRRQQWGKLRGIVSGSIIWLENASKLTIILIGNLFKRETDIKSLLILSQCKSIVRAYLPLLLNEDKYLAEINKKSEMFFNGGVSPVKPPVFKELG